LGLILYSSPKGCISFSFTRTDNPYLKWDLHNLKIESHLLIYQILR
jgi:hypothetical protein